MSSCRFLRRLVFSFIWRLSNQWKACLNLKTCSNDSAWKWYFLWIGISEIQRRSNFLIWFRSNMYRKYCNSLRMLSSHYLLSLAVYEVNLPPMTAQYIYNSKKFSICSRKFSCFQQKSQRSLFDTSTSMC